MRCRGDIAEAIGMYRSQSGYDAKHIEKLIRSVFRSSFLLKFVIYYAGNHFTACGCRSWSFNGSIFGANF